MTALQHPFLVHLPLALSMVLPLLVFYIIWLEKKNQLPWQLWIIPVSAAILIAIFSFLALQSGEAGEHILKKVVGFDKQALKDHEHWGERFAKLAYLITFLSLSVFWLKNKVRRIFQLTILGLSIVLVVLAVVTGKKGGALVYEKKAANYLTGQTNPLQPSDSLKQNNATKDSDE